MKKVVLICLVLIMQQAYAQDSLRVSKQRGKAGNFSKSIFTDPGFDNQFISLLPYADLNKVRLFNSAGVYYGSSFQLQGVSSGETNSIVDGMQVDDISCFPQSAIKNYQYFSNTTPIEYGNTLCGIAEISTLTPNERPIFDINILSSATAGKQMAINQKQVTFMYGSPLSFLKPGMHDQKLKPSVLIAGNLNFMKDPFPSFIGSSSVNEDTYTALYNKPLIPAGYGSGTCKSSEFVTKDNFRTEALRNNTGLNSFNPYIKILFPISQNIRLALGSYMNINWGKENIYSNALFNSEMNPDIRENNYSNFIRLEHDIIDRKDLKLNYRLQLNYTYLNYKQQSAQHKDKFFEYGYVGKFKIQTTKSFEWGTDNVSGISAYLQNGFIDTLVTFEPSAINLGLSNYTQSYFDIYNDPRNLDEILMGGGLLNGYLGSAYQSYQLWNNVGIPDNNYIKTENSRLNPKLVINMSFKEHHQLVMGFEYDRCSSSSFTLHPTGLWNTMRSLVNRQLFQLDLFNPHLVYDQYGHFQDTILYDRLYDPPAQTLFDVNLRQQLGLAVNGTEWIDIFSYDPSVFSLDMFSADEILNSDYNLLDYFGYDYTGKKSHTKNALDFFSKKSTNGYYNRNIAPFKPWYLNAWAQYSYTNERLTVTAGLRIDLYNANQPVLKDPFLLFNAKTAKEVTMFGPHPANIGDDYIVYVDYMPYPTNIKGYRNGFTWYDNLGNEVSDPGVIEGSLGITPYLSDPNQSSVNEKAFTDYKPTINYLPLFNIEYLLFKKTQVYGSFQMMTQNPVNNNFKPQHYFYFSHNEYFNNPDLKPEKLTVGKLGIRQAVLNILKIDLAYIFRNIKGLPVIYKMAGAYPKTYITLVNSQDDFVNYAIDLSVLYQKPGKHQLNIGGTYERLLNENKKFYNIMLSKNVANIFAQYSMNRILTVDGVLISHSLFSVSLVNHFRSETYYVTPTDIKYKLPNFYYFDIRLEKPFYLGKHKNMCANVFVAIQNILNKKNVFSVYPSTGKADDDGYLSNPLYQWQIASQTSEQAFRDQYSTYINDPGNYDIPRMLLFGFSFGL